jgi:hypothetical protein
MRLEGWELRLEVILEASRRSPYQLGHHDCFSVACSVVEAMTGVNHWLRWAGTYSTPRQALVRIAEYGGNFDGAAEKLFGSPSVDVKLARRGDIVKFVHNGEPHLGVINGSTAAVLGPDGLRWVERTACERAWRIG